MKDTAHFAHGNGFPSPCYHQLLIHLQKRFQIFFIDQIGHSPDFPVTENWHNLVDELMLSVNNQASQPVIAIGHSLGGVLSFRAAVDNPDLFKAVILLDSPIMGRFKSRLLRLSKNLGMIDRITPAFRTRGRRHYWQTKAQALSYLRSKQLFKNFTNECLEDYINYGMNKDEKGYSLRFDRQIEYQIYRTIPHILYEYEGRLSVPSALIYGDQSHVVDRIDLYNMKKKYNMNCYKTKGTHMFPMEYPEQAADLIFKAVDDMNLID